MFEFRVGGPRAVLPRPEATEKALIDAFDLKFDSRNHRLESEPVPWSGWDALRQEVRSLGLRAPHILHLQAWGISVALPIEIEPTEIVIADEMDVPGRFLMQRQ